MAQTATSQKFQRKFGDYQHRARREPPSRSRDTAGASSC
jgi:hypothetical protein